MVNVVNESVVEENPERECEGLDVIAAFKSEMAGLHARSDTADTRNGIGQPNHIRALNKLDVTNELDWTSFGRTGLHKEGAAWLGS